MYELVLFCIFSGFISCIFVQVYVQVAQSCLICNSQIAFACLFCLLLLFISVVYSTSCNIFICLYTLTTASQFESPTKVQPAIEDLDGAEIVLSENEAQQVGSVLQLTPMVL